MKLNKAQKILIVKWYRDTYGIPDITGNNLLGKGVPKEIMEQWKKIFPNDWSRFNRGRTLRENPSSNIKISGDNNNRIQDSMNFLLNKLKGCGNLNTKTKYDEDTGEPKLVKSTHLLEIIEDYMVEVLDEMNCKKRSLLTGRKS